jgi:dTMP kinase
MIIAIEGIDGSGKSTLAEGLRDQLFNYPPLPDDDSYAKMMGHLVRLTHFPRSSWVIDYMKKMSEYTDSWFYPAACIHIDMAAYDLCFFKTENKHASDHYILDRWVCSTQAYQTAQGMPSNISDTLDRELTKPDLTVYVDVPTEVAMKRIKSRGKELHRFEEEHFLNKVGVAYSHILPKNTLIVDGTKKPSLLVHEVMDEIRKRGLGVTPPVKVDEDAEINVN